MSLKRRLLLTVVALLSIAGGCWVFLDTFGRSLKGTESRSVEIALESIQTLVDQGVLLPDGQTDLDLAFAIKEPIKDEIHSTMNAYLWVSPWMILIGFAIFILAWMPGAPTEPSSAPSG